MPPPGRGHGSPRRARIKSPALVQLLVDHGAEVNVTNRKGADAAIRSPALFPSRFSAAPGPKRDRGSAAPARCPGNALRAGFRTEPVPRGPTFIHAPVRSTRPCLDVLVEKLRPRISGRSPSRGPATRPLVPGFPFARQDEACRGQRCPKPSSSWDIETAGCNAVGRSSTGPRNVPRAGPEDRRWPAALPAGNHSPG